MQPSREVPPALAELIDEPVELCPIPDEPGLVLWPDCEPDVEPELCVLGDVVLVLGEVVLGAV
jgi:hypothetical protein